MNGYLNVIGGVTVGLAIFLVFGAASVLIEAAFPRFSRWLMRKLHLLAGAAVLLVPMVTYAQAETAEAPIPGWASVLLVILAMGMTAILAALAWGGNKLKAVIAENIENTWIAGALTRLTNEVYELAELVGTPAEKLIIEARRPDSPGGEAIVASELDGIAKAILEVLKRRYGGWGQMFDTLKRIGLGGDSATAETAVLEQIKTAVAVTQAKRTNPPASPS